MRPGTLSVRPPDRAIVAVTDVAAALAGAAVSPSLLAAPLFVAALARTRSRTRLRPGTAELPILAGRLAVVVVVLATIRPGLAGWTRGAAVAGVVSALARLIEQAVRARRSARGDHGDPTVVVGRPDDVVRYAQMLARHPEHGLRPIATATPDASQPTVLPGGAVDDLKSLVGAHSATHVLLVSPDLEQRVRAVIDRHRPVGVRLSVVPPLADRLTTGVEVLDLRGLPVLSLSPRRDPSGVAWLVKRAVDYAVAGLGLVLLMPLFVVAAVAIKLDSPGPVFFRQKRVGRHGRLFEIWKFRSMVVDAEDRLSLLRDRNQASAPYFKMVDDPRVTRVGRLLRATCIDELPQLLNVLRGEMSLVGPRPCLAVELAEAPELFEWRLPYLPGVTGLWQVAGRSWLPMEEGLRMDLAYVEHWGLGLDLQVAARTLGVAVGGNRRPSPLGLDDRATLDRARYSPLVAGDDLRPRDGCDLSVIVVTHESASEIAACLESVQTLSRGLTCEVIVVDNASSDGTADLVEASFPGVRLIRKPGRHGFATNCNIGAVAAAGRNLLFLNPDARLTPGAVEALTAHLEGNPEVGAVAPRLVFPDGSPQASARRFPSVRATLIRRTPLRWLLRRTQAERRHLMLDAGGADDGTARHVDWVLGAAVMMRASLFSAMQGLDDRYRLYCEDIDLCWRLHEQGWLVDLVPSATVVHDLSELTRRRFLTRATLWHLASMARFVRLHGFGRPVATSSARTPIARLPRPEIIDLRHPLVSSPALGVEPNVAGA